MVIAINSGSPEVIVIKIDAASAGDVLVNKIPINKLDSISNIISILAL